MAIDYSLLSPRDQVIQLEDLMRQYSDDIWKYALYLTQDKLLADDITQETFLRVFEKLETYREHSHIKTWLLTITRNLVKDYWKKAWTRKVRHWGLSDRMDTLALHSPSAEEVSMKKLELQEMGYTLCGLPPLLQEAIVLYSIDQLSYIEIADRLEVPLETVKSRIHRARQKIRLTSLYKTQYL